MHVLGADVTEDDSAHTCTFVFFVRDHKSIAGAVQAVQKSAADALESIQRHELNATNPIADATAKSVQQGRAQARGKSLELLSGGVGERSDDQRNETAVAVGVSGDDDGLLKVGEHPSRLDVELGTRRNTTQLRGNYGDRSPASNRLLMFNERKGTEAGPVRTEERPHALLLDTAFDPAAFAELRRRGVIVALKAVCVHEFGVEAATVTIRRVSERYLEEKPDSKQRTETLRDINADKPIGRFMRRAKDTLKRAYHHNHHHGQEQHGVPHASQDDQSNMDGKQ
jgi:hypothetical protein